MNLVKLGGSVITVKEAREPRPRRDFLRALAADLAAAGGDAGVAGARPTIAASAAPPRVYRYTRLRARRALPWPRSTASPRPTTASRSR